MYRPARSKGGTFKSAFRGKITFRVPPLLTRGLVHKRKRPRIARGLNSCVEKHPPTFAGGADLLQWHVIAFDCFVAVGAKGEGCKAAVAAVETIPVAFRRPEDADVGLAVTVIIAGCGAIGERPELHCKERIVKAVQPIPGAFRLPIDRYVGLAVAVVVGGNDLVCRCAELRRREA